MVFCSTDVQQSCSTEFVTGCLWNIIIICCDNSRWGERKSLLASMCWLLHYLYSILSSLGWIRTCRGILIPFPFCVSYINSICVLESGSNLNTIIYLRKSTCQWRLLRLDDTWIVKLLGHKFCRLMITYLAYLSYDSSMLGNCRTRGIKIKTCFFLYINYWSMFLCFLVEISFDVSIIVFRPSYLFADHRVAYALKVDNFRDLVYPFFILFFYPFLSFCHFGTKL